MASKPRIGLIVFAHGSRVPEANEGVRRAAGAAAECCGVDLWNAAFLELAEPTLESAVDQLTNQGADKIIAATLKAIGYSDAYLMGVVLQEAVIISVFGFLPALLLAEIVYRITTAATLLPISMTIDRALIVYAYTLGMCAISGLLAARRLRSADPASIF